MRLRGSSFMNFTILGLSTIAMLQMGCHGSTREQHLLSELQQKHQLTGLAITYAELKCCDASKGEDLNIIPFQREAKPRKVAEFRDRTVLGRQRRRSRRPCSSLETVCILNREQETHHFLIPR